VYVSEAELRKQQDAIARLSMAKKRVEEIPKKLEAPLKTVSRVQKSLK